MAITEVSPKAFHETYSQSRKLRKMAADGDWLIVRPPGKAKWGVCVIPEEDAEYVKVLHECVQALRTVKRGIRTELLPDDLDDLDEYQARIHDKVEKARKSNKRLSLEEGLAILRAK